LELAFYGLPCDHTEDTRHVCFVWEVFTAGQKEGVQIIEFWRSAAGNQIVKSVLQHKKQ